MKKIVLLSLVLICLSGCVFANLGSKEKWEEQFITGDEKSSNKILVIPAEGMIASQSLSRPLSSKDTCTPDKINEML